jgi:hypothetical protein
VSPARVNANRRRFPARDLGDHVRGGTEAEQAEALPVSRHPKRPEADQPGAEKRRGLPGRIALGDRKAEAALGHGRLGEAAFELIPGEEGPVAEVLAPAAAERAVAARPAEPRHPDPGTGLDAVGALADCLGDADDLVS